MYRTLQDICAHLRQDHHAAHGRVQFAWQLSGDPSTLITGVAIDSRRVRPGDLFIALQGERTDGHRFVVNALARGAAAALVERPVMAAGALVQVPDCRRALWSMADLERRESDCPWIGITGSAGKTTARNLLAHLLGHRFGADQVLRPEANHNNDLGLPMTLCGAHDAQQAAVVELGTNAPGEIATLAGLARPQVGIVTSVGAAHIAQLGDVRGVAREKGALLRALPADGVAIIPCDIDQRQTLLEGVQAQVITVGLSVDADLRARVLPSRMGEPLRLVVEGVEFTWPHAGLHQVRNLLLAVAAARCLGLTLQECAEGLADFELPARRGTTVEAADVRVIDDAYNANPTSFTAALMSLDAQTPPSRRVLVAGDMLELGDQALPYHQHIGRVARQLGLRRLITVGPLSRELGRAAVQAGLPETHWQHCADAATAADAAQSLCEPGDTVLVKASNGMHLEHVVDSLCQDTAMRKAS